MIEFFIEKKEESEDFWDHILKTPRAFRGKCKTDFNKWIDEDDEGDLGKHAEGFQGLGGQGQGGMPPGMMGGMPGR